MIDKNTVSVPPKYRDFYSVMIQDSVFNAMQPEYGFPVVPWWYRANHDEGFIPVPW
ncbi:hypothetical protein [Pseudobutyrivibrio ruminis]|uniref:hypothetical protein n=1 Tax=Pseudobutyrivibrio ruminis TaxID=46206 RepID=UPI0016706DC4|nr:hypothetical protein [Pseudobutyrivibrio ruminis]